MRPSNQLHSIIQKVLFLSGLFIGMNQAFAQALTLDACLDSAATHMPLLRQQPVLAATLENKIRNFNTAYLPVITANGQVSSQSDVPELPFSFPGVPELNIPKNQYKAWLEVNESIYDGGLAAAQKAAETSGNDVSLQSLAVDLNEYRKQIVEVYFQVLLADRQTEIVNKVIALLNEKLTSVQAAFKNGVLQQNDVLRIQAELLDQDKQLTQLAMAHGNGLEVLGLLTGIDTDGKALETPQPAAASGVDLSDNPELHLLETQQKSIMATSRLLQAQRMPRLSLFGQAGFGDPNPFNFFKNESSGFYIAGLRASWNIFDWNKVAREKQDIGFNTSLIDFQKEQKKLELQTRVTQLAEERNTYQALVQKDSAALELRQQIRKNASSQLNEGVITSTQYLDEVLNEQQTEINKNMDEISMMKNAVLIQLEQGTLMK